MNRKSLLLDGILLIIVNGLLLLIVGYSLQGELALQVATFMGGLMGYIIYSRISTRAIPNESHRTPLIFSFTLLMSLWASLCLLVSCTVFSNLPLCSENRRNGFIILYFFFPMLIVFISWTFGHWKQSQ